MASPELSITLSVAQLLQFEVCASLSEEQPRLQLGTLQQSSLPAGSQDLSSVDIKFETQLVDGQRILRVFAIPKAGSSHTGNTSSSDANTFQHCASYFENLTHSSATSSCSNASSTISSPAAYDCSVPDDLMKDINYESFLSSFSSSDMYLGPLGSLDQLPPLEGSFPSQCNEEPILLQCNDTMPPFTLRSPPNPENSETYSGIPSTPCQLPSPVPTEPAVSAGTNTRASNTSTVHHEEELAGRRRRARRFACLEPTCSRKFASKYTLGLHMSTHQPGRNIRYACQMGCTETFSRQHDRLRHEVSQHGRVSEWTCVWCRHVFSSQSTHDKHKCSDLGGAGVCH